MGWIQYFQDPQLVEWLDPVFPGSRVLRMGCFQYFQDSDLLELILSQYFQDPESLECVVLRHVQITKLPKPNKK